MWEQHAARLEEFREAFVEYDGLVEVGRGIGGHEAVPLTGVSDTAVETAQHRLALAAGRATHAANVSVSKMGWTPQPAVGGHSVTFAPVENWQRIYDSVGLLAKQNLLDCVDQAIGVCLANADEAQRYEHGIVGWFAAFLAFPDTVG